MAESVVLAAFPSCRRGSTDAFADLPMVRGGKIHNGRSSCRRRSEGGFTVKRQRNHSRLLRALHEGRDLPPFFLLCIEVCQLVVRSFFSSAPLFLALFFSCPAFWHVFGNGLLRLKGQLSCMRVLRARKCWA